MQTKQQLRLLLESAGIRPNKRFGQHFLIDLNLMRLLLKTAGIKENDVVFEVGCGTGSLTEAIAEQAGFCIAVEIDPALAQIAQSHLAEKTNVKIIAADALKNKFEINTLVTDALNGARARHAGRLLLVANLPYSAATPLMLNLVTGPLVADAMFVTVQKEVAARMTAAPGSKDYGVLSILLAATGDVRHIRTLKPSVFWPQPNVESAMVAYTREPAKVARITDIAILSELANVLLQHRRKVLKTCCRLAKGKLARIADWDRLLDQCGIDPRHRPEMVPPDKFVDLANACCRRLHEQSEAAVD